MARHQHTYENGQHDYLDCPPNVAFASDFAEELACCHYLERMPLMVGALKFMEFTPLTIVIDKNGIPYQFTMLQEHPRQTDEDDRTSDGEKSSRRLHGEGYISTNAKSYDKDGHDDQSPRQVTMESNDHSGQEYTVDRIVEHVNDIR